MGASPGTESPLGRYRRPRGREGWVTASAEAVADREEWASAEATADRESCSEVCRAPRVVLLVAADAAGFATAETAQTLVPAP